MKLEEYGVAVFIAVAAINAVGLLIDWWLKAHGYLTITDRVYANPVLGVPILLLQLPAFVGLILHLYYRS